jgi:hypothetical protein
LDIAAAAQINVEPATEPHNRISKRTGGFMKLADKEWNLIAYFIRKWESDNRKPFGDIRDAINAVLAKRNVAQPVVAEQPVDGDMVDQMLVCIYGPKCGEWSPILRDGMAAAARILLVALRGPVTAGEYELWKKTPGVCWSLKAVIEYRIDRIM